MKSRLRQLWISRTPAERVVLMTLAVALGLTLYLWFAYSTDRARDKLRSTVTALRTQADRLDQQAAELERLRASPAPAASQGDLRTLLDAQARAAGLSGALVRIEAQGSDQVQASFGGIAFADWLAWVASLQSQHIRLQTCRVEAQSTPGLVSTVATFTRAK